MPQRPSATQLRSPAALLPDVWLCPQALCPAAALPWLPRAQGRGLSSAELLLGCEVHRWCQSPAPELACWALYAGPSWYQTLGCGPTRRADPHRRQRSRADPSQLQATRRRAASLRIPSRSWPWGCFAAKACPHAAKSPGDAASRRSPTRSSASEARACCPEPALRLFVGFNVCICKWRGPPHALPFTPPRLRDSPTQGLSAAPHRKQCCLISPFL